MSRDLDLAPFAVTSDGKLFLNVAKITTATDLYSVVRAAEEERGAVFVGVMLSQPDTELALARLDNAADETAAHIVCRRRRRKRRRDGSPHER